MQAKSLAKLLATAAVVVYVYCAQLRKLLPRPAGNMSITVRRLWVN